MDEGLGVTSNLAHRFEQTPYLGLLLLLITFEDGVDLLRGRAPVQSSQLVSKSRDE